MTFCSAVMCGNRLKRWNTMPVFSALARDLRLGQPVQPAVFVAQAEQLAIEPDAAAVDASSSWLMQRSSVVLPEPDAPIRHSTSPARTSSETPLSAWNPPNAFVHGAEREHERRAHRAAPAMPRAKRRSSSICNGVRSETTSRYQRPATISSSMTRELA